MALPQPRRASPNTPSGPGAPQRRLNSRPGALAAPSIALQAEGVSSSEVGCHKLCKVLGGIYAGSQNRELPARELFRQRRGVHPCLKPAAAPRARPTGRRHCAMCFERLHAGCCEWFDAGNGSGLMVVGPAQRSARTAAAAAAPASPAAVCTSAHRPFH